MARYSTIQKLDRSFMSASFAASLKPPSLQHDGANYKTWRVRSMLWFTAMHCEHVIKEKHIDPPLSPKEEKRWGEADNLFKGALISIIVESMLQVYMDMPMGKDMWGALEAKFGVADAGSLLYLMEQFYDYKMVNDRSVVEQAHEIQMLAKELKNMECELPDKFVAGGIIAKLPPT